MLYASGLIYSSFNLSIFVLFMNASVIYAQWLYMIDSCKMFQTNWILYPHHVWLNITTLASSKRSRKNPTFLFILISLLNWLSINVKKKNLKCSLIHLSFIKWTYTRNKSCFSRLICIDGKWKTSAYRQGMIIYSKSRASRRRRRQFLKR